MAAESVVEQQAILEDIKEKERKLILMEKEMKEKCDKFDLHKKSTTDELDQRKKLMETEFKQKCDELAAKEENLNQRTGNLNASDRFMKIQLLLDEVYTLFVAAGGKPEDLYESLKLVLEARAKF